MRAGENGCGKGGRQEERPRGADSEGLAGKRENCTLVLTAEASKIKKKRNKQRKINLPITLFSNTNLFHEKKLKVCIK